MIRKAIIITTTTLAVGLLIAFLLSYTLPSQREVDVIKQTYWPDAVAWRNRRNLECTIWLKEGAFGIDWRSEVRHHNRNLPPASTRWKSLKHGGLGPRLHIHDLYGDTHVARSGWLKVPVWLPLMLLSVYPIIAFVRGPLRRYRRRKRNQCDGCGYDLTGNESGRCPECGKAIG